MTGCAGVLIVAQPDMGTAMVLGCVALAMLFVSGVRLGPVFKILAGLICVALVVAVASPYRRERLLSFIDPVLPRRRIGLPGAAVAHRTRFGPLHRRRPGRRAGAVGLPAQRADRLHLLGHRRGAGLHRRRSRLGPLGAFVWFGIRAATRSPQRFGGLLAVGLVAWLASETLINIGAVVGVLPVTGIPLPFISFGGSSLVITMVAAGILINIARQEGSGAFGRHCPCAASRPERTVPVRAQAPDAGRSTSARRGGR